MSQCKAIRQGDQMVCGTCGLAWDVGDKDRPACKSTDVGGASLSTRIQRERSMWKLRQVRTKHGFKGRNYE